MKLSHALKVRLSIYSGILIAYFMVLWGLGWHLEWDVNSGRERRVTAVWGISLSQSEPMETIVSKWHNQEGDDEMWVRVASGPLEGTELKCLGRVVYHFEMMSSRVADINWKQTYATWVLDELAQTGSICIVGEHCLRVSQELLETDGVITIDRLHMIWLHTTRPDGWSVPPEG